MKLSRNKIRKLYKQRNQSFKRGKNNNNQPKRFKKQYTFRQKISDTNSFENNHNDNHTIHSLSTLLNKTVKTYIPKFELSRLIDKYKNIRRIRKNVMRGGVGASTTPGGTSEPDQSDQVIVSTSFNPDNSMVKELLKALLIGKNYNYVVTQPINGASEFELKSVRYGKIETPEEKPPEPPISSDSTQRPAVTKPSDNTKSESSKKEEFIISPGDEIIVAAGDPISEIKPPGTVFINDAKKGTFTSIDEKGNITVKFDEPKLNITLQITANRIYKKGEITIEELEETQEPKFAKLPLDGVRLIISDPLGGLGNPKVEYLFNITSGSEIKINSTLLSVLKFINNVEGSMQKLKEENVKQLTAVLVLLETFVTDNASKPENLTKLKDLIPKQITNGGLDRFKSIFDKAGLTLSDALEKAISDAQPEEECVPLVKPDIPIELTVTMSPEGVTTISPAASTAGSLGLTDFVNQVGTQSGGPAKQDEEGNANATAAQPPTGQPTAAQPAQPPAGQVNAPQPAQPPAAPAAQPPAAPAAQPAATTNTGKNTKGGHRNISRKSKHKRNKQSKSTIRKNRK